MRDFLYRIARAMGDINAIMRGKIARRIGYRVVGKYTSRILNRLFR